MTQAGPLTYNGSGILAMVGKDCVGICSDNRLGAYQQTIATDFKKVVFLHPFAMRELSAILPAIAMQVFKVHDQLFIGLCGLATDVTTFWQLIKFKMAM
jgi:20S proteasome subunit beta 3